MTTLPILDHQQLARFARDGLLLLPNFYDIDRDILPVRKSIHRLIGQVMKRHGVSDTRRPFAPETFDDGYEAMIATQRSYGGEIYDAIKQIPAFLRLVANPRHEQVFRELRHGSIPGIASGGYGIRIDNPGEDRFRAHWHQEYPAQLRSLDGLVFWSPLLEITELMGPVKFCIGSQNAGMAQVVSGDSTGSGRSGAYALSLHNEERVVARHTQIAPLTSPGDLIIADFLTLHASGFNRSDRARWSMQFRYFNFDDPTGLTHGWQGSFASGVDFRKIHPELCVPGEME